MDPSEIKCHDPILSQALAEEKDYSCDIALGYRHINVGYELASQDTLDEALMLWSLVLQGGSSNWRKLLRDIVECWFLEQIKVVSEVYLSSFRVSFFLFLPLAICFFTGAGVSENFDSCGRVYHRTGVKTSTYIPLGVHKYCGMEHASVPVAVLYNKSFVDNYEWDICPQGRPSRVSQIASCLLC